MPGRRPRSVLLVIGSLEIGGAESQLAMLAGRLAGRGWRVSVFALDAGGPLRETLERQGCTILDGGIAAGRGAGRLRWMAVLARAQLRLMGAALRADVVHGFLPLTNFMAALAGRLTFRHRIVTSRRALGTHQDRHPRLRWMDLVANRLSHVVTANSGAVADDVARRDDYPRARIVVIGNGLDVGRMEQAGGQRAELRRELGLGEGAIGIVKVANLIPYKGHAELIEAFASLAREDVRLTLFLIGEDRGLMAGLSEQAQALGVAERVRFLGRRQDVPALLGAMDIGVMASHEEGFSNALIEKLAAGLPVVATDVGGNPEALEGMPNCRIVPARRPEALQAGLRELVAQLPEASDLPARRKALLRARCSIEAMVEAYEAVYAQSG